MCGVPFLTGNSVVYIFLVMTFPCTFAMVISKLLIHSVDKAFLFNSNAEYIFLENTFYTLKDNSSRKIFFHFEKTMNIEEIRHT